MDAALSANKQVVLRLVDEVITAVTSPGSMSSRSRGWRPSCGLPSRRSTSRSLTGARTSSSWWRRTTVVARFRCTGTQQAPWQGLAATGRRMDVDEVSFIRMTDGRISGMWALEDTWTRMRQLAGDHISAGELGALG